MPSDGVPEAGRTLEDPDLLNSEFDVPEPGWHGRTALFGWLLTVAFLVVAGFAAVLAGRQLYQPPSRLPQLDAAADAGLLGVNRPVMREVDAALALLAGAGSLNLSGGVRELEFPRSLADRLLGKRHEHATLFGARTATGTELRFLVLRDGKRTLFAVEPPSLRRAAAGSEGWFVILPLASGEPAGADLEARLSDLLATADRARESLLSSSAISIFGPFNGGDTAGLRARIEGNLVLSHLASSLDAAGADVSLSSPVLLLKTEPERGRVRALYQPLLRIIQEPLWGDGDTAVLAHELTHAFLSRVVRDEVGALQAARLHFEANHPLLFKEVIGELYEGLDSRGRAEEALAFITGSVAAGDTKTNAAANLLQEPGLLSVTEPILKSDIELLVSIGLLAPCMAPQALNYEPTQISFDFYNAARSGCAADGN